MLYLIGLGLNVDGISIYGLEIVNKCKRVYLENYTVDFSYSTGELGEKLGKKFVLADRGKVESLELVDEAQKMDVALLIYGSPLTATTHISLIQECKRLNVRYKIIYNASIFDAVAETGLQLYKFGKVASMPEWKPSFTPDSFMKVVQENQSMKAHSLILMDIGLEFQESLEQLEESAKNYKIPLKKLVVCQALGTKHRKILYKTFEELKEYTKMKKPYCIIIPSKMHFLEKEVLEEFGN
ncbi:MAG: diphthine synthase [Nanoarchaeota archaeon]